MTVRRLRSSANSVRRRIGRLLDVSDTIRRVTYLGIMVGMVTLLGYCTIGATWAITHQEHLQTVRGLDRLFSTIGEIVVWPLLLVADITLK